MEACSEQAEAFRSTFVARSADDQRTLEALSSWAEQLCRAGVVKLAYKVSPQGRDRYLELALPAYANLGRERFLTERLGALQRPTMLFGEPKNLLKVKHFGLPSSLRQPWRRLSDFSDWQRGLIVRDSPRRSSYKTSWTRALRSGVRSTRSAPREYSMPHTRQCATC